MTSDSFRGKARRLQVEKKNRAMADEAPPPVGGEGDPEEEDVANAEGEEDFEAGLRHAAADYQAHDADGDHKLDFDEFCALVRDRESGDHTEEELRALELSEEDFPVTWRRDKV